MNQSKAYFKGNTRKRRLSDRAIGDYVSRLKSAVGILKMNPSEFYRIKNPRKLMECMEDLKGRKDFLSLNENSQGSMLTAVRAYTEAIQVLHDLKPAARNYLKEYFASYQVYIGESKDSDKATDTLHAGLMDLLSPKFKVKNVEGSVLTVLNLKNTRELGDLLRVVKELDADQNNTVVFSHFEATAKIIAIKGLIKELGDKANKSVD